MAATMLKRVIEQTAALSDPLFILMPFKRKIKLDGEMDASVEDKAIVPVYNFGQFTPNRCDYPHPGCNC